LRALLVRGPSFDTNLTAYVRAGQPAQDAHPLRAHLAASTAVASGASLQLDTLCPVLQCSSALCRYTGMYVCTSRHEQVLRPPGSRTQIGLVTAQRAGGSSVPPPSTARGSMTLHYCTMGAPASSTARAAHAAHAAHAPPYGMTDAWVRWRLMCNVNSMC
jgi:hypothetical protein